jgi:MerR family transcriptional regulator, heat shock protein HspR
VPSLPLDDENLPLFTVGQVSIMLEVQQAFLRRLDDFGVVTPSRSGGGQRRYTRREITVVQYVVRLAGEGVSLAGIRRIMELEAQVRDLERRCIVLQAQLRQIREQAGRAALEPPSGPEASRLEASGPEASGSA